jgi:hypothetical protein
MIGRRTARLRGILEKASLLDAKKRTLVVGSAGSLHVLCSLGAYGYWTLEGEWVNSPLSKVVQSSGRRVEKNYSFVRDFYRHRRSVRAWAGENYLKNRDIPGYLALFERVCESNEE